MTTLTILALAAIVIALVVRQRRAEVAARNTARAHRHPSRRELPTTPVVATGDAAYLTLPADPAAPVYTDLLADYEAARADWTVPDAWGDYHRGGPQ